MRQQRERPTREEPAAAPERPARPPVPAASAVLELQRGHGNQAVARALLQRREAAEAELPPIADNLRRYRKAKPRLRALAARQAPAADAADLSPALAWLTEVSETLQLAEPLTEPSALLFESLAVPGHDAEYTQAEHELAGILRAAVEPVVPAARQMGEALARTVMRQINGSSVAAENPGAEPQLPPLADVQAWARHSSALRRLAAKVDRGGGLAEAAHACEDAALAMLQARSVLSARETWRADDAESSTPAQIANPHRPRNEVDDIFADSGFNRRQSLRPNGTRDDWCGMFVAASMFRGAALDKNVRLAFAHTDNVFDFFTYNRRPTNERRTPRSIWAEGQWWDLREYHRQRGLERTWAQGAAVAGADIRPGDVALIRHRGVAPAGEVANHIVMVESWDPAAGRLVTIEGNVHEGVRPGADGEAQRTPSGALASTTTNAPSSTAVHVRDLRDQQTLTPGGAGPGGGYQERGARTVFGVGRPSLVDFESHEYGLREIPAELTAVSPDEMRASANRRRLAPVSTLEAP